MALTFNVGDELKNIKQFMAAASEGKVEEYESKNSEIAGIMKEAEAIDADFDAKFKDCDKPGISL